MSAEERLAEIREIYAEMCRTYVADAQRMVALVRRLGVVLEDSQ